MNAQSEMSAPLEHRTRVEQARALYSSITTSILSGSVVMAALAYVHLPIRPPGDVYACAAAFATVAVLRLVALILLQRKRGHLQRPDGWIAVFAVLTVLAGLVWGSTAWLLFRPEPGMEQALLMFSIAGLAAGGIVNLASSWSIAWAFIIAVLGPFLVRFATMEMNDSAIWLMLLGLFLLTLMLMSRRLARDTLRQIRSRLAQRDRDERRLAEQAMYRTLVESTTAVLWQSDAETLELSYISPEVESVLGYPVEDWLHTDRFWAEHVHPEDRDWLLPYTRRESRARRPHNMEYRMRARDGSVVWIRDSVNVVTDAHGRAQLVGVMLDITEQHLAQRRLEYASGLQRLMVEASREFIQAGAQSLDRVLSKTLERVGRWCEVDRAYLIRFNVHRTQYSNTHEWTAPGVSAEMQNLQRLPTTTIPKLLERLERHEAVLISSVKALSDEWAAEKELFEEEDVQALICLPVVASDRLIGLVGFDAVHRERIWTEREASLLQVLGDLIGAAIDRVEVDVRLRSSEALRRHAEALADMGSWQWRVGSERFDASDEWRKVTGVGDGPLTRSEVLALTPEDERELVEAALQETVETGRPYSIEHRITRPDNGEERWIKVHADLYDSGNGMLMRGFAQDITARKQDAEALFRLAHYDSLTGLPNRVLALDRLDQAIRHARRSESTVALLFIDLDYFKKVNDTLGHAVGDRILTLASERLTEQLREEDTVARIGGDEFLILLDDGADERNLVGVANKLLHAFREPFDLNGRDLILTTSIGIAVFPQDGETHDELMRNADTAMYHAKSEGRNGFQFFTAAMNEDVSRQLELEEALRLALVRGELSMVYQPIVRVRDGRPVSAEALLRWAHPTLGAVSPEEFIPLAEHVGLIERIGEFVMQNALRQLARWHASGHKDMRLSINVSPHQFREESLAENLLVALDTFGIAPSFLSIEITEGVLLSGNDSVYTTLNTLRDQGVGIVMDDFGTGFSSLGYLRDYPFDTLKIDRRFVQGLVDDKADLQLVVSAIRLAQALDMNVVAEGVETEAQDAVLAKEGCEYGQGYLYGHPVSADAFQEYLDYPVTVARSE